ncbi:MAG: crosslink repair DNA glycosylase YcaQ family protein [Alphaproteobacteria bacterium]|nr:crosslink repair DNA glycosylase YcaQ family protein [Alphaproteobacteria bacterium]
MAAATPLTLTAAEARRLILWLQGLSDPPYRKIDADGLDGLIGRMGYVQVDSVKTVERAHHMILHGRSQTYRPRLLSTLHAPKAPGAARLFENWTHDASLIPVEFFPYWRARFRREAARLEAGYRRWHGKDFHKALDHVAERIAKEGPLMARHFEEEAGPGPRKASQGWWDWRASKIALEFHWRTGGLAVAKRDGFQKVYDLTERVIPEAHRTEAPEDDALIDWACREAIRRLGFGAPGDIARFFDLISPAEAKAWCARQSADVIVPVTVEGVGGRKAKPAFAVPEIEALVAAAPAPPKRVRVLSPFDPVIRDRKRLAHIFGFDYRIEIFVPEAQRKFGYYVFPLLEGDRLIGRIDMTAAGSDAMTVKGLWLEPGVRPSAGRLAAIRSEVERQARFAGVAPPDRFPDPVRL